MRWELLQYYGCIIQGLVMFVWVINSIENTAMTHAVSSDFQFETLTTLCFKPGLDSHSVTNTLSLPTTHKLHIVRPKELKGQGMTQAKEWLKQGLGVDI